MDKKISDSTSCNDAQNKLFTEGKWCPDPAFAPPNDLSKENMQPFPAGAPNGHVNFLVYRAAKLDDPYAIVLANSNAADRAGVLSYLHSEVVPEDMRFKDDIDASRRKFGIDSIMVFNVTVYNPLPWLTPDIPLSPYVAFNGGACKAADPGCAAYKTKGYQVGYQVQSGNIRAKYSADENSDYWYSFPKGGLCDKPNGTKACTYTYNVVGRYNIDELVHFDRLGYESYAEFSKFDSKTGNPANIEFARAGRVAATCCNTTAGIPFWNSPCDLKQSFARIERLMYTKIRSVNDTKFYNMTKDCGDAAGSGLSTGELIAIIAGSVVVVGIGIYIVVYMLKAKNKQEKQPLMGTA